MPEPAKGGSTGSGAPAEIRGVLLPRFGLGGAPLGDPGGAIPEAQAQATIARAWELGVRYFDTAPWYGNTKSEHRFGTFLREQPRSAYIVSTKVGRVYFRPRDAKSFASSPWMARWPGGLRFDLRFDYSRDGILRSYEDSLMRLGLNRVDMLLIHDLDPGHQRCEAGVAAALDALDRGGGYRALCELRDAGEIGAIGAGINVTGMIPRFLERFELDIFLVAMPYTLLDQQALDVEFPLCAERDIRIVIGAVFASGILAARPGQASTYGYKPATPDISERVACIERLCARHEVSLKAAAIQFPLAHPLVASVIPGANHPDQVQENFGALNDSITEAFWEDLKNEGLIDPRAPTPNGPG